MCVTGDRLRSELSYLIGLSEKLRLIINPVPVSEWYIIIPPSEQYVLALDFGMELDMRKDTEQWFKSVTGRPLVAQGDSNHCWPG